MFSSCSTGRPRDNAKDRELASPNFPFVKEPQPVLDRNEQQWLSDSVQRFCNRRARCLEAACGTFEMGDIHRFLVIPSKSLGDHERLMIAFGMNPSGERESLAFNAASSTCTLHPCG